MIKRALLTVGGIFGLCLSLFAQQNSRTALALAQTPDFFGEQNSLLRAFSNRTFLPPVSFAWVDSELAARQSPSAPQEYKTSTTSKLDRSLAERLTTNLLPKMDYANGEVGFVYGHSAGKGSGDFMQTYIMGETGNDRTQIFAGASYEESSVRFPRR